ncbi:MAG: capsular biosynthesis protein [Moraxella sp.]|nr:capsular biosynthesis protein [Moraxella sp.]
MTRLLTHRHILLLQGKMGSFFCRFASYLMSEGLTVSKINFNAGDAFFYCHKDKMTNYRGSVADFEYFLQDFVRDYGVDAIICFNDCRPHHLLAKTVCETLGLSFFVFEEGYLRPDYITLQEHGINGYSQLNPALIETLDFANDKPALTYNRFWRLCMASVIYYTIVLIGAWRYPYYTHYRGLTIWQEMMAWLVAPWRKLFGYLPDKHLEKQLITKKTPYFLVALQVHNDSQISHHSDYADVRDFIREVMVSFAVHADDCTHVVFKHHPLDRGHRNYQALLNELSAEYGLTGRVHYGCDMHLPTLIRGSLGMVTINSTTALQSIYHKKPTKVMGRALYNIPKLTYQQPLDDFWHNTCTPDHEFYLKFREYLIEQTQLNGSFYGKSPWMQQSAKPHSPAHTNPTYANPTKDRI